MLIATLTSSSLWAAAPSIARQRDHNGITLIAMSPVPGRKFDTSLMSAETALRNLAEAFDRLTARSPLSARRIARLEKSGRVILVYLPDDLKNATGGESIASFLPDFLHKSDHHRRERAFLVVVGRHGIKWPVDELAATLGHELVGHGIQHQRGRLMTIRVMDAECEAYLYEEIANQDLGLNKRDRKMVTFRRNLEEHWCADFKGYLRRERPGTMSIWDTLNPDVPKLLGAFESYLQHSADIGATARAIDALKRQTRKHRNRSLRNASPEELFRAAVQLRDGAIGISRDPSDAFRIFRRAAKNGHTKAWINVARMYEKGIGIAKNLPRALTWYQKAAALGDGRAQIQLGQFYRQGVGGPKDPIEAYKWFALAASNDRAENKLRKAARAARDKIAEAMTAEDQIDAKKQLVGEIKRP